MGKGVIKYGGKSGVLPKPHSIFKKPLKPVTANKSVPQGYAPNIKHPKGSTRDPIIPQHVTLEEYKERIESKPGKIETAVSEVQKYKQISSALRKQHLIEALETEQKSIETREQQATKLAAEKAEFEKELQQMEFESQTTKLTLPTIESFLQGPLMRPRTGEENRLLRLKRKANRLTTLLKAKEQKAANLLSAYYDSDNFIIDEDRLNRAIDAAFEKPEVYFNSVQSEVKYKLSNSDYFEQKNSKVLSQHVDEVLFGSAKENRPGVLEIDDTANGEMEMLVREAEKKAGFVEGEEMLKRLEE